MRDLEAPPAAASSVLAVCAFVLCGLGLTLAPAAHAEELTSPRAVAMGNAFVGGGNSTGALFHNPAGLVTAGIYALEIGYQNAGVDKTNSLGAAVIDAKTNPSIAAGAAYSYTFGSGPTDSPIDDVRDHAVRVGLAFPAVPQRLALGLGLRYENYRAGFAFDNDPSEIDPDDSDVDPNAGDGIRNKAISLDLGVMAVASQNFLFGFAVQNVIQPESYTRGRVYAAGVGIFVESLHLELAYRGMQDPGGGSVKHGFSAGVEYTIDVVPIRAGFERNGLSEANYFSAGFGWRSQSAGFDAAYRQNLGADLGFDRTFLFTVSGFL